MLRYLVVVLALMVCAECVEYKCQEGKLYDNQCYIAVSKKVQQPEAIAECGKMNAKLVEPRTKEIYDFVVDSLLPKKDDENLRKVWLGLESDNANYAQQLYFYPDKTSAAATYTNWAPNEPSSNTIEYCTEILRNKEYTLLGMNNVPCDKKRGIVCQTDAVVVTTTLPPTIALPTTTTQPPTTTAPPTTPPTPPIIGGTKPATTVTACDGDVAKLNCPGGGKVVITSAFYGRADTETCPGSGNTSDTKCDCQYAKENSQLECKDMSCCEIDVSSDVFGDPCPGTSKYLTVEYRCD